MTVRFYSYVREYTGCKEVNFPFEPDLYHLLHAMAMEYGKDFRELVMSPDGEEISREVIIMINGKRIDALGGINTPLSSKDAVAIYPVSSAVGL